MAGGPQARLVVSISLGASAAIVLISAPGFGCTAWHDTTGGMFSGGPASRLTFLHPLFLLPALAFIGTIIWGYGDLLPFGRDCPSGLLPSSPA